VDGTTQGSSSGMPFDKELLALFQHASSDPLEPGQSAELLSYTWYQALSLIGSKVMDLERQIAELKNK